MALQTGLEGYWKLDSTGFDSSGQGRPLSLVGTPGFVAGQIGQALALVGSPAQYADRPSSDPAFDFASNADFTIQAWVRPNLAGANQVIASKNTPTVDGWSLHVTGAGPTVGFEFEQVGVGTVTTPLTFAVGAWHHVVVVKTAGSVEVFVDGASAAGPVALGAFTASTQALTVGQEPGGTLPLTGDLDELGIWSVAKTSAEVVQLYNGGAGLTLIATPTVSSITPSIGVTRGETFVTILGTNFNVEATGGFVRVSVDGVLALEAGVVDSTRVLALTPRSTRDDPAQVDVLVENVLPNAPGPDMVEPVTVVTGFEYRRPNLETRRDHATDNAILIACRFMIRDLRRHVVKDIQWDVHPEYVDALSALAEEEKQAPLDSAHLKLIGPTVEEDRFYATGRGGFNLQKTPSPGLFDVVSEPVTVMLSFQYVGVGRTKGEVTQLWTAVTAYFARTEFLVVPLDGVDEANGTTRFEIGVVWEERAEFNTEAGRQGVYQFTGRFLIRGVHTTQDKLFEGQDSLDGPLLETLPVPEGQTPQQAL